jgi:hypothetical protein
MPLLCAGFGNRPLHVCERVSDRSEVLVEYLCQLLLCRPCFDIVVELLLSL